MNAPSPSTSRSPDLLAAVLVLPALYAWRLRNPRTTRPTSSTIVAAAPEI
jgi:hypothetical protein